MAAAAQPAPAVVEGQRVSAPVPPDAAAEEARWQPMLDLPCQLTVEVPLPGFTVADFLKIRTGSVLATQWRMARDVPVRIQGRLIGWGEFEVLGNRLAVRLTELA